MIWPLFKKTLRQNWKLWIIFAAVLTMYMSIMISMFDPESIDAMLSMLDMMPKDLMEAMGFTAEITSLASYLASWLYGLLMLAFPMVYIIILANRLIAKMVDDTSFAFLLSTPNSRIKIVLTQAVYGLTSILLLFVYVFLLGLIMSASLFPGELDVNGFFRINLITTLVNATVFMICFFFSVMFNESRQAVGLGSAIPIGGLLFNMMGNSSEDLEIIKRLSIYGYYDPVDIANGSQMIWLVIAYLLVASALFGLSLILFKSRRLPL
ncbi:MAG: ABC transporter permease subunit [Bacilli bacterium]|nr:ABC transporter permease subunit [Bacilli bacterium]MBN2697092.1 ABC transporter permease subunit [Bacilli bacterium]